MRRVVAGLIAAALLVGCLAVLAWLRGPGRGDPVGYVYPLRLPAAAGGPSPVTVADSGPPLFFVDQESVPGPGLLARAAVSGAVRLFAYDEPGPEAQLAFAWVLRNPGTQPVTVTVMDRAAAAPGRRYLSLAASVQRAFLAGSAPLHFQIAPGGIHILRDRSTITANAGQLAFSIYDLRFDGSLQILDVASTDLAALGPGSLPSAYPGGSGIGALFPHDTRRLQATLAGLGSSVAIAAHNPRDPGLVTRDPLTGATNADEGNYGVTYRARLVFPPSRRRSAHLWVTAGSCALRADFLVQGRVLQLPAEGALPPGDVGAALADVALSPDAQTVLSFDVLPPAASCTPITLWEGASDPASLTVRLYQSPIWRPLAALWARRP